MEVISKEVEHPIHFYLSSLEEQVRSELLDSEARITQTKIKDRILLEIDEDRLQHFLDVVHEKTEEEMKISQMLFQANANLKLKNCHQQWQEEKSSYQAQMDEQRAETNRIAAALKETQDLLEIERHVQPKTAPEEEMEVFKNLCQATVDEQLYVSSKLKEDLDKAKRELETVHLQWQYEHFHATRQVKDCEYFHSQMHIMAFNRAHEQEAAKQGFYQVQAFYQAQMYEQSAETNRISAALKETQDLLEAENSKLKAALIKGENELKNGNRLWQKEKSSFVRIAADFRRMEREARQTLQRFQEAHEAQMDQQRAETNRIAAALKETQDLLDTERQVQPKTTTEEEMEVFKNFCQATVDEQFDVNSKLKADLDNAKQELKNGLLQWQEEKSSYQVQMDEQRAETTRIAAALKETQDLLDTERQVQPKTTTEEEMEMTINQQLDENSKLKAALIKAENEVKNRNRLWQKEKSSFVNQNIKASELYQTQVKIITDLTRMEMEAKQTLQRFQEAHKGQMDEQRAETSKILAVLKKTEDQLEAEHLNCLELASSNAHLEKTCRDLDPAQLKNLATLQTLEEETTQMFKRNQAFQAQLKDQRAETNRIKAARKKTEDMFENEGLLWQQEKYLLQATEEDLQSQITNMQKKKKKWFKLF